MKRVLKGLDAEMIKLKKVMINKYKCIETEQSFHVEDDVTVLVGKNESGKTAILEAIVKFRPFLEDQHRLRADRDYPRKYNNLPKYQPIEDIVFAGTFVLSDELFRHIQHMVGDKTFSQREFTVIRRYGTNSIQFEDLEVDSTHFLNYMFKHSELQDDAEYRAEVIEALSTSEYDAMLTRLEDDGQIELRDLLRQVFEDRENASNPVHDYIAEDLIESHLPRFLYYDEYYQLPTEINLHELLDHQPTSRDAKTSQALVELAGIDVQMLLSDDDERVERVLEDASRRLTATLRNYWKRDDAPRIILRISKASIERGEPALIIRVENDEDEGGLPLESRSKGFKYFFSFMVWFSKIQEDDFVDFVLLLDEPGLSLHSTAQADLLGFFEDLAKTYQIIYTTHSQFMIDFSKLYRVRTVSKKGNHSGTQISNNLEDGDRDALLPLQAALGYNIVQSMYIGEHNLIVEGYSDFLYLQTMSSILRTQGRTGLLHGITIIPVAGVDKAPSFIALFRGNGLEIVCLLDTFEDAAAKQRVDDVIKRLYISEQSVRYFAEFAASEAHEADIEDLFDKSEYLKLYNATFTERRDICVSELDSNVARVTQQIRKILKKHYNHTRVAKYLARIAEEQEFLSQETLDRFENMFKEVNRRFEK